MVDRLSYPVTGDHHLSDGWEDHIARGSLGGVDFPVAYGTPVYASHDGFLAVDNSSQGSGGRVATVQGGGITTQCLHMSSFTRGNGDVARGEHIGYSGASAYGSDYGTGGPHVHWHAIVNGIRVNPLNYLAEFAGGDVTPITPGSTPEQIEEEELMAAKDDIVASNKYYVEAARDGILSLLQLVLSQMGNDDAQVERILDATRRENRPRVYQIKPDEVQGGRAAAIDVDEGYFRSYGSAAELDNDKRLSLVAPETLPVTKAEFDDLEARAKARLADLQAEAGPKHA